MAAKFANLFGFGCCSYSGGILNGYNCGPLCASLPADITITPQPGNGGTFSNVTTVLHFRTNGPPGNPVANSTFTNAGGPANNCWWSDLITNGGASFYWIYVCGGVGTPPGGLNFYNTTGGVILGAYSFNSTHTCSPFLLTGTLQSGRGLGSQKWVATG